MKRILWALIFSIVAMAPTLPHFSARKFGPNISGVGSDSYGTMQAIWLHSQPVDNVIRTTSRDLISGYPEGIPIAPITSMNNAMAFAFGKLGLSPAAAYNLTLFICFLLAFLITELLASTLGIAKPWTWLAAWTVAMSPYQVLQSVDHLDLAATWVLLLFIYYAYRLVILNQAQAAAGVLFAAGLSVWAHPYYFVMCLLLGAILAPLSLWKFWHGQIKVKSRDWVQIGSATLAAGFFVLFWRYIFTSFSSEAGIQLGARSIQDLYTYSTKFWDFILPPHYSWLFSSLTNPIKYPQTAAAGTNLVENTLYPGLLTALFALSFAIWFFVDKKRFKKEKVKIFFLFALIVVPVLFSISPTLDILGISVPTPTLLIHQVINEFRTMSRFGLVTDIGLTLLMAYGLNSFFTFKKFKSLSQNIVAVALALFAILDFGYFHSDFYSDTADVPAVYQAFQNQSSDQSVLLEVPYIWGYVSWFWETYHHRRNYGVFIAETKNYQELMSAKRNSIDQWVFFARSHGITHLILHSQDPLQIPSAQEFKNDLKDTQIFFMFANYSYLIDVDRF